MEDVSFDINKEKIQMKKNGEVVDCDILFTFDSEDTMKSYVGYTDGEIASNGRKNIYVSSFNPALEKPVLENVTDEREVAMIADVLQKIDEESV